MLKQRSVTLKKIANNYLNNKIFLARSAVVELPLALGESHWRQGEKDRDKNFTDTRTYMLAFYSHSSM